MAWPFGLRKTVLLAFLFLIGLGYTPSRLRNSVGFLLVHTPNALWSTVKLPTPPAHTLKAAILNVTKDFDELSHLVQDFLRQPGIDPAVERQFRAFLADRAVRSHPHLENSLDWLLAIYKFAFPFLLISMIARLSGGGGGDEITTNALPAPPRHAATGTTTAQQKLEKALSRRAAASGSLRHRAGSLKRPASPGTPQFVGGGGGGGGEGEGVSFHTARSQIESEGGNGMGGSVPSFGTSQVNRGIVRVR